MAMVNSPLSGRSISPVSAMLPFSAAAKFPVHFEIVHQILPAVAGADVTDRAAGESACCSHDQMNAVALGVDQCAGADFRTPPGIAGAESRQVRRQQRVETQLPAQRLVQTPRALYARARPTDADPSARASPAGSGRLGSEFVRR